MKETLEEKVHEVLGDELPKGFGTGWWSGVLSVFFGILAFGAVVCLHFPQFQPLQNCARTITWI